MLISPVVIPIEENVFFRRTAGKCEFGPHQILPASMRIVTKGSIRFQKSEIRRTRGPEEHVTSRCDKKTVFDKKVTVLVTRGIEATIPAKMPKKKTKIDVKQAYRKYYFNIF